MCIEGMIYAPSINVYPCPFQQTNQYFFYLIQMAGSHPSGLVKNDVYISLMAIFGTTSWSASKLYFNLMCLFFPSHVNVTSWTVAYAIPYHALKLYNTYKVGYGIISQQAKEANMFLKNQNRVWVPVYVGCHSAKIKSAVETTGRLRAHHAQSITDPYILPCCTKV